MNWSIREWGVVAIVGGALFSACASPATVSDDFAAAQAYNITGVRVLSSGQSESRAFTFSIITADPDRLVVDFTAGDFVRARDTATTVSGSYELRWNGNVQFNHMVRFRIGSCEGNDVGGDGALTPWGNCSIARSK